MAHIHILALEAGRKGGAAAYTAELIRQFAARGHRLVLICHQAERDLDNVCEVRRLPTPKLSRLPWVWRLAVWSRQRTYNRCLRGLPLDRPDVIIGSAQHMIPEYLRRFPEAPFLYVPHSLVAPLEVENMGWPSALQRWISARVFHRLELLALNQALYTIRFTNTGCHALREYYGKNVDPRFVVLPIPVTIPQTGPAHRINDPPQLLFVGRLVETKNVAWLIRCLYGLKDLPWNLSIVGDGEQRQTLEALSRDCGLSDRIVFHGQQDDVAPFYRQAELFVFPSRLENSPIVLLEAMSYGVPTLSIRADGNRYLNANHEIITADHDGFVADNEEDFAAKLRGLLTSPERLHTVGKQARQTVEKRNQWSDHISGYERIFEGIQTRPASPRETSRKHALESCPR